MTSASSHGAPASARLQVGKFQVVDEDKRIVAQKLLE